MKSNDEKAPGHRSGQGTQSLRTQIERAKHCVLVVDDNAATRYSVARGLRAGGYMTREAAAGVEALQLVVGASALVLDVHLPDIDGMEVCRLVRANPATARLPVVHISARHKSPEDAQESAKAGADAFLSEPFLAEDLLSVIDDLLSQGQDSAT